MRANNPVYLKISDPYKLSEQDAFELPFQKHLVPKHYSSSYFKKPLQHLIPFTQTIGT